MNSNLIYQGAINPWINDKDQMYKDKAKDELAKIQADKTNVARSRVATYIYHCFMK